MHPEIRYVVYPVHLDGTPTGQPPRMRHDLECGGKHFDWRNGEVLGTPVPATPGPDEDARGLRALRRSPSQNLAGAGARERLPILPSGHVANRSLRRLQLNSCIPDKRYRVGLPSPPTSFLSPDLRTAPVWVAFGRPAERNMAEWLDRGFRLSELQRSACQPDPGGRCDQDLRRWTSCARDGSLCALGSAGCESLFRVQNICSACVIDGCARRAFVGLLA